MIFYYYGYYHCNQQQCKQRNEKLKTYMQKFISNIIS